MSASSPQDRTQPTGPAGRGDREVDTPGDGASAAVAPQAPLTHTPDLGAVAWGTATPWLGLDADEPTASARPMGLRHRQGVWDLPALLTAADPGAPRVDRHLWLVRLVQWLRQPRADRRVPLAGTTAATMPGTAPQAGPQAQAQAQAQAQPQPQPLVRLKHLLNVLERNPEERARVVGVLRRTWGELDVAAMLSDTGFGAQRRGLWPEMAARLRLRLLPATLDTEDAASLLAQVFDHDRDAHWLSVIDDQSLQRLSRLLAAPATGAEGAEGAEVGPVPPGSVGAPGAALSPGGAAASHAELPSERVLRDGWQAPVLQAMDWLVCAVRADALGAGLRRRMAEPLLRSRPFDQLAHAVAGFAQAMADAAPDGGGMRPVAPQVAPQVAYLRAVLQQCHLAAASVRDTLTTTGISASLLFEVQQLQDRLARLEDLLNLLLAPQPAREMNRLLAELVRLARERRSLRSLGREHFALLARHVAERHAETGEHYITRTRDEYRAMLRAAAGGGVVIAGTTFAKFGLAALPLAPFWGGWFAGWNYALSFLLIYLLHWTVATKQPAMTAPAMADKLREVQGRQGVDQREAIESFVDEVGHLVRSQMAGIVGNLALVVPVVLAVQGLAWWLAGRPLVGQAQAEYVLHSLTLLGPTALFAAFTGVLLFASSVVAGWTENWFVYHRLDSALAHHPRLVARLGAARAARWAAWWRRNISGVAANVSLGLMLGLVPPLLQFVGLAVEVRHVTLSTGQLAAAVGALGPSLVLEPAFWWCVAGIASTGVLNLGVSFWLALQVAMRSRGITVRDRRALWQAIRARLRRAPRSFVLPPAAPV